MLLHRLASMPRHRMPARCRAVLTDRDWNMPIPEDCSVARPLRGSFEWLAGSIKASRDASDADVESLMRLVERFGRSPRDHHRSISTKVGTLVFCTEEMRPVYTHLIHVSLCWLISVRIRDRIAESILREIGNTELEVASGLMASVGERVHQMSRISYGIWTIRNRAVHQLVSVEVGRIHDDSMRALGASRNEFTSCLAHYVALFTRVADEGRNACCSRSALATASSISL